VGVVLDSKLKINILLKMVYKKAWRVFEIPDLVRHRRLDLAAIQPAEMLKSTDHMFFPFVPMGKRD